jgi:hypothetical protein
LGRLSDTEVTVAGRDSGEHRAPATNTNGNSEPGCDEHRWRVDHSQRNPNVDDPKSRRWRTIILVILGIALALGLMLWQMMTSISPA